MPLSEAERERMLDRMVQRRLARDRDYKNAEDAESQAEREAEIERDCEQELDAEYGVEPDGGKPPSGIRVNIFRWTLGDCSNGGVSGRCNQVTLILPQGGPDEPSEAAPAVRITQGGLPGTIRAVEYTRDGWAMMGGAYIASCDGRFAEECERVLGARFYGAVAFHDRYETAEQSRLLSV